MERTSVCRFLPWDSEFFGFRIGRVESDRLSAGTIDAVMAWCAAHAIDCLYLLSDAGDHGTDQLAQAAGFQKVDVRLTLVHSLMGKALKGIEDEDPAVRECRPQDVLALAAVARASHTDSRFYADPNFARSRCDALYETWLTQNCRSSAHQVLIAQWQDQPVGYISFRRVDERYGEIELLGVSAAVRGRGLGRRLVYAALRVLAGQGLAEVAVVTQERNTAARQLYQHTGFMVHRAQFWYHRWFRVPAAVVA
jgi:dTDP-4-amino-4,6-dideoxy-D-galactose acyltransferase